MNRFVRGFVVLAALAGLGFAGASAQEAGRGAAQPAPGAAAGDAGTGARDTALEEIVVTADFREGRVADLPVSVSVLDAAQLRATTVQHFEEAIREVPNLNLSG